MPIVLRDYQQRLFDETRERVRNGERAVLMQLPTGGGKTPIAATILKRAVEKGAHAHLWLHRRELAKQSILELDRVGVECGLIAAGFPQNRNAPVQICLIQSLARRVATTKPPDIIIVDECHHSVSESYSKLLAHYKNAVVIGMTATPIRLDSAGLDKWFKTMVLGPSTAELIAQKWLSPYRIFTPSRVDLSKVHVLGGDYQKNELDAAMKSSTVAGDALAHYQKYVPGKRALIFAWSIESSQALAAKFNAAGIPAAHIDGTTEDSIRDQIVRDFGSGVIKVLTNVDIVSEGFNVTGIQALFLLRPTKSLGLYLQQIGRGLRPDSDKDVCWIFVHWNGTDEHGFPDDERSWNLAGAKKRKRDASSAPLSRTCPMCSETSRLSVRICPCGFKLVLEREIDVDEDAELTELDPALARRQRLMEQGKADTLDKLIELGRRKGYRHPELWARHLARAREEKAAARQRQSNLPMDKWIKTATIKIEPESEWQSPDPWAF